MSADSFFARWSQRNAEAAAARNHSILAVAEPKPKPDLPPAAAPAPAVETPPKPLTLDDVARLTPDSDFTPFVARGVDETVKRSAMKKLFADPHFNVMDGLDVYIDDYNKFVPLTPAMLAMLNHAQALLNPLAHLEAPLMRLLDAVEDTPPAQAVLPEGEDAAGDQARQDIDHRGDTPPTEEPSTDDNPV